MGIRNQMNKLHDSKKLVIENSRYTGNVCSSADEKNVDQFYTVSRKGIP